MITSTSTAETPRDTEKEHYGNRKEKTDHSGRGRLPCAGFALALAGTSSLTIAGSPALAAEDKTEDVMHGPDVPPKGMRYDEWKGFQYTTDREFDLRTFWTITMYDHSKPESHDLFRDPEHVEDAVLKIVDAKSEPVGGEMKLRSGGFVDITVELYWTGTMNGVGNISAYDSYYKNPFYVQWSENAAYPCDAYTGTSLLNYFSSNDDAADDSISPGQASASSMAESDITWNGRTYRLFASRISATLLFPIGMRGRTATSTASPVRLLWRQRSHSACRPTTTAWSSPLTKTSPMSGITTSRKTANISVPQISMRTS